MIFWSRHPLDNITVNNFLFLHYHTNRFFVWLCVHLKITENVFDVWCLRQRLKLENHEFLLKIEKINSLCPLPYISKLVIQLAVYSLIGLSRLRSATFEHLLRLGASFCGSNNLEQFVPFLSNFSEQGRFRAHIKHEKANDFIENFKSFMV